MSKAHSDRDDHLIGQQFRLLVESLKDYAVFMIGPEGRILTWNPGVQQVLGYSESEFIGKAFHELFTPEDIRDGRPEQEMAVAAAQGRCDDTRQHVRTDGTRFWADGVLSAMRDNESSLLGYARLEDRRRAVAAGYQFHVAKPIDPRSVAHAVATLVRSSGPCWS